MKKNGIIVGALVLGIFTGGIAFSSTQVAKTAGVVSVSTSSTKEIDPDYAEISLAIETTAKSVEQAAAENKINVNKIIEAIKSKIDEKSGDTIKTDTYSVRPDYTYAKDGKRTLVGYTVVNSLKVKISKVNEAGKLIDSAIGHGANRLENLTFGYAKNQNMCNDMYPQLVKDAQNQASIIARALNKNVSGVKNISTSCSTQYYNNVRVMLNAKNAMTAEDSSAGMTTPVEPGKIKVYASINADFTIE